MNVSLTAELERFVTQKVQSGLYTSNSEVVREALRLLRQRERARRRQLAALPRSETENRPLRRLSVTLDDLRARRGDILMIAARHGAGNVRVFGSVVRGDAGLGSDVDFLVDMETGRSLMDRSRLLVELQELLGCAVDVATESSLRRRVRERALREALPL
jgi:putative addiction module CopG family antidote